MPLFRDGPDFADSIQEAARRLGLQPKFVEKDYWVTETLRALLEISMTVAARLGLEHRPQSEGFGRGANRADLIVFPAATDSSIKTGVANDGVLPP